MSDFDSEIDSDEESELQDLEQINTAIAQLDNEEPCTSASITHEATTVASICSSTSSYGEYSKVETALALNRMCDEKLRRLEGILNTRLLECRRRLTVVQIASESDRPDKTEKFSYLSFGKPYFKDKRGFPAPDNEDTILMRKSEMYNFSNIASVPGWTVKDKCQITKLIHKMSKGLKKKRLHSQILALQRENKKLKTSKNNKKILELKEEIVKVNEEPLTTLALPIDEEYDWDHVANKLSNRHSANEYRSLWKLFLHPSINKTVWSKEEHMALQKISLEKDLQDWDAIARELGTGRTNYQCFVYFRTNMNNTFTSRKWSKEEEEYLIRLIEYYREDNYIPWGKVAASMENRTKVQVYNKHARLVELRKGKFLPEEDSVILACINIFGPNFRKVTEYLHGRSVTQCRERYHVLAKRNFSTVWTIEEDQKLVQVMANQDALTNFSTVSKYFPGKDRVNIRTRYITLHKWMRRNPNVDITHAPRRSARRLLHGKATDDLNRAIEDLKKRLEEEVIIKKKSKITKDSPEDIIDDAIVALVATENARKMQAQKLQEEEEEEEEAAINVETEQEPKNCNIANLRKILILLKAKLNKQKFKNSPFRNTYRALLDAEPAASGLQIRSYSKREAVKNLNTPTKVDIWGNPLTGQLSYVLPPHIATITGCKQLMAYYIRSQEDSDHHKNMNVLIRRNMLIKEQVNLLMERFNSLFLWPMLLSNVTPEECMMRNAEKNHQMASTSKSSKKHIYYVKEDYNFAIPPPSRKLNKMEKSENIDLTESEDSQKIDIDQGYFDSIQ